MEEFVLGKTASLEKFGVEKLAGPCKRPEYKINPRDCLIRELVHTEILHSSAF